MNAKQAKQIPLSYILNCLGYQPAKETHGELWYYSPFRQEKEASFKINPEENIWYDFGEGEGGNVLDFIMTLYEITSISTALSHLEEILGVPLRQERTSIAQPMQVAVLDKETLKQPQTCLRLPACLCVARRQVQRQTGAAAVHEVTTSHRQIDRIQPLQTQALIQYLHKRGICREIAALYVLEIYYWVKGKKYFSLAFPNLSGGYELRNPYFKGVIGKKDISLLMKRKRRERTAPKISSVAVTIFEGFMDFLSALAFYQTQEAKTPVIVLNSLHLKKRATERIREMGCAKVYLYVDRDDAGRQIADSFRHQLDSRITIQDKSSLYAGYKDFNEFLVQTQSLTRKQEVE